LYSLHPAPGAEGQRPPPAPVTRPSGKKIVMARFIRTDRLAGALHRQAQSALRAPPGARARYYDEQRDRGLDHNAALRVAKDDVSIAPAS